MINRAINALARHANRVAQYYEEEDYEPRWYEPRRVYCVLLLVLVLVLMQIDSWQLALRGWRRATVMEEDEFGLHYPDLIERDEKIRAGLRARMQRNAVSEYDAAFWADSKRLHDEVEGGKLPLTEEQKQRLGEILKDKT